MFRSQKECWKYLRPLEPPFGWIYSKSRKSELAGSFHSVQNSPKVVLELQVGEMYFEYKKFGASSSGFLGGFGTMNHNVAVVLICDIL